MPDTLTRYLISRRGFLAAGALLPGWLSTTGGKLLVPPHSPLSRQFFFVNSYTGEAKLNGGSALCQPIEVPLPNQWLEIDLCPLGVPKEAVAVMVGAILIITNGEAGGESDLAFSLKAPSADNPPDNYCGQAIAVGLSGARTNMQAVCPIEDGRIHIAWLRGSYDEWPDQPLAQQWPQGASYGINATIEMVMLP